jgi:hypothetical protein
MILTSVVAIHAALIALLLQQAAKVDRPVPATSIAMIAIDAERPAAAKPPPPSPPAKVADTFVPVTELSIPDDSQSDAPAGASAACSTLDKVREGLLLDAVAVDAIRNAPPETRSIADAVVIWNVGWAPSALTRVDPLFVVRAAIERDLASVPDNCLDEAVAGPRLLPIPDASGQRTIFIVFGSGVWTWRALLSPPPSGVAEEAKSLPVPNPPATP